MRCGRLRFAFRLIFLGAFGRTFAVYLSLEFLVFAELPCEQINGVGVYAGVGIALVDLDIVFSQEVHRSVHSYIKVFGYFTDLCAHMLLLNYTIDRGPARREGRGWGAAVLIIPRTRRGVSRARSRRSRPQGLPGRAPRGVR